MFCSGILKTKIVYMAFTIVLIDTFEVYMYTYSMNLANYVKIQYNEQSNTKSYFKTATY